MVRNDGQGSCVLQEGRSVYSQAFAPDASLIYWAQDADDLVDIEGWYAPSDRCHDRRRFSADLAYLAAVPGGLIYADSDPDRMTMTLKFAALTNGALPDDGGVVVQAGIDLALARGGPRFVVYAVSRGEAPGLYAFGPLP